MAWIAALIGAIGGGAASAAGGQAQDKASKLQLALTKAGYKKAVESISPYKELGDASLRSLGELMGIKGYRTAEEQALTDYLKTAPKAPNASAYAPKGYGNAFDKLVAGAPIDPGTMGSLLGANPMLPPGAAGALGGIGGAMGRDAAKDEALAKMTALSRAKSRYNSDLEKYKSENAAWEEKRNQLQYEANQSLENYDPMKVLQSTPGYMARYNQGLGAVQAGQVGHQLSGRAAQELQRYGQDYASSEFSNEVARRSGLAGMGQNASTTIGNWGIGQAGVGSNIYGQMGQNQANTYANYNNVLQGSLSNYLAAQNRDKDRDLYRDLYRSIYG